MAEQPRRPQRDLIGQTITVLFNEIRYSSVKGQYNNRVVSSGSGHPQPQIGETWRCSVLADWGTGIMVALLEKVVSPATPRKKKKEEYHVV